MLPTSGGIVPLLSNCACHHVSPITTVSHHNPIWQYLKFLHPVFYILQLGYHHFFFGLTTHQLRLNLFSVWLIKSHYGVLHAVITFSVSLFCLRSCLSASASCLALEGGLFKAFFGAGLCDLFMFTIANCNSPLSIFSSASASRLSVTAFQ